MPTTDPIVITPSTSVVLVNTADFSGNPIVLLPNVDSLGRIITIRDADGGSLAKPIYISTTGGALFQQEISSVTISSLVITQPYGFYTITPRLTDIGGTTRYGIMNAFAFRESSDYAYVNMFNANMAYTSTLSTVNVEVHQDLNVVGNINVTGSINYTNPGSVTFNADIINTRDVNVSTIRSATTYASTLYASSMYLANTLEASTMHLSSRPIFDLSGSGSWVNYMNGGTDPNSMTLGSPGDIAGAQIATDSNFFGIRSFNASSSNFSTSVITRDGNVGINLPYTNLTYNAGAPNYNLAVKGSLRLSNYDARTQQADILFRGDGRAGASNRYVNAFAGTNSQYTLYSANNYSQGFYTSGNEYQWITAEKGATYPDSIKFWTGNNQERMRIDSVGNVGIGKTNPGQALDVSGAVAATAMSTIAVSTATVTTSMGSFSLPSYSFGGDENTGFYSPAADTVAFATGGGERMVINSAGQVGITATTGVALDVSGQIRTAASIVLADGSVGTPSINFTTDTNTGIYHPLADTIGVVTAGSERVRVDSTGKVGIGKTPATYQLEVSGNAQIIGTAGDGLRVGNSTSDARIFLQPNTGGNYTEIKRVDGANGDFALINQGTGNIYITANSGTYNGLAIQNNGRTGIGYTTTPDATLNVTYSNVNTATVNPTLRLEHVDGASHYMDFFTRASVGAYNSIVQTDDKVIIYSDTNGNNVSAGLSLAPRASGTSGLRLNSSGQVAIGKTTATVALDVVGQIKTDSSIVLPNGSLATPAINFGAGTGTDANTGIYHPADNTVGVVADGAQAVLIDGSGIQFKDGSVTKPSINFGLGSTADPDTGIYHPTNNTIGIVTAGAERMRIDLAGNVGIGKTPGVALDVVGQIKTDNSILVADGTAAAPSMTFTSDTDTGIYCSGTNEISLATTGTQRVIVNSTGNVGIGTTPSYKLDVGGTIRTTKTGDGAILLENTATIQAKNSSGTYENFVWPRYSDNWTYMNYGSAGLSIRDSAGNSKMVLDSAGNVGIGGGTDSSYKLKVTGDLNVTGSITGSISVVPAGCIMMFGGSSAPTGWLLCDGTSYAKSSYPDLSNSIGNTYGGSATNFNVPDLRDRVPVGLGTDVSSNTLGYKSGSKTHTLTIAEMPAHSHSLNSDYGSGDGPAYDYTGDFYPNNLSTGDAGGGQPHNNMQPYIVVNYIIKT